MRELRPGPGRVLADPLRVSEPTVPQAAAVNSVTCSNAEILGESVARQHDHFGGYGLSVLAPLQPGDRGSHFSEHISNFAPWR